MPNTEHNTSNYKSGRIPVIALDYSSRQLAEKRELLIDYENAKIYVVSAEDRTVIYDITAKIIQTFKESGDISNFTVEVEGLGTYNLGDVISKIYLSRLNLVEDKEFQYNAPTTSFDNTSLAIYDRQASLVNFKSANDRTVPMKVDGYLQWKEFDIETLSERVAAIEATAPPDANEFASFRTRLAAIEATDELYKDLPNMKSNISSNTASILEITNELTKFNELDDIKDNIKNLENTVTSHTAKIKYDEAKLDTVAAKTNANDSTLQLLEERANTNAATLTDLLTRTGKLENIDAGNRLSTVENNIVNINNQLKSIASSDTVNDLDNRLHTVEDNYNRDISSLTNSINNINTKITGYDSDIPSLKTKVANLETSVASLSGIDMDQINNNIDQKVNSIKQTVDSYTQTNASLQTLVDQLKTSVDAIPVYTAGDGIKISSANEISLNHTLTTNTTIYDNINNDKKYKFELHNTDTSYILGGSYPEYSNIYSIDKQNKIATGGIFNSKYATIIGGLGHLVVDSDNASILGGNSAVYGSSGATIVGGGEIYSSMENLGSVVIGGGRDDNAAIEFGNSPGVVIGEGIIDSAGGVVIGGGDISDYRTEHSVAIGGASVNKGDYSVAIGGSGNTSSYYTPTRIPHFKYNTTDESKDYADIFTSLELLSSLGLGNSSFYDTAIGGAGNTTSGYATVNIGGECNKVFGPKGVNIGGSCNLLVNGDAATSIGGRNSIASGAYSVAIGGGYSKSSNTIAIGPGAVSYYDFNYKEPSKRNVTSNIAIGLESVAKEHGTISFGHKKGDMAPFYLIKDGNSATITLDEFKNDLTTKLKALSEMVSSGVKPYDKQMHWPLIYTRESLNDVGIFRYSTKDIANVVAIKNTDDDTYTGADDAAIKKFVDGITSIGLDKVKKVDNTYTEEFYNRLVNAADGISAHDVATVGQTIALSAGDNITVTEDGTNDIGQKKFKISASFAETPLTIDKIESVVTADTTRVNNLEYVSDSTHSINNINVTQYGFTKDIFANKQFLYLDTTDNKIKLLKFSEKTIN